MLQAIVNKKVIHRAIQATADAYESALDSGMDFIEPETPEYSGYNRGCFEYSAVPQLKGLVRSERKFGVQVIGVLDKNRINGYYRAKLLCLDGSILEDDVMSDELKALPELRKGSAFDEWIGGSYPTDPIMETSFFKIENKDKLSSCILCGRTLTHMVSIKRHVGPECYKRIGVTGNTFMEGDEVAQGLIDASEKYSEERFRKWIIRAVLTLDAPLPEKTLYWLENEYFGYSNKPSLYYLDAGNKLNCVEVKKKRLIHRRITSLSTCENDLDYRALGMVKGDEMEFVKDPPSPFEDFNLCIKGQWLFFDGNDRPSVFWENNNFLWCNCHKPNCRHLQKVKELIGGKS